MEIISLIMILLFMVLGYFIKYKKKYQLIAGLNDYRPNNEKLKAAYDMQKIGNIMGNACFLYSFSCVLLMIFKVDFIWVHLISLSLFLLYLLVFMRNVKKENS